MNIDQHILIRYFLRECSEDEKEAIRQWLENSEENKKQFIRERIRFDASVIVDEEELRNNVANPQKKYLQFILRVAASIFLLLGSGYLFSVYRMGKPEVNMQSIYVPAGSRTSLTLSDGTLVWLNSNTSFHYPNIFSGKNRVVELDGEAYFEVTSNKKKSFIVKAGQHNVEALGTTFNVEAYSSADVFKTGLFEGKVRVFREDKEADVHLLPGEAIELKEGILFSSSADTNSYRWKDGLIILDSKSFEEIMLLFEKYFDLQIIIENEKVKREEYQGKLRIADGIDHALRVLQNDYHFTYKREGDTNIIRIY